MIKTVEQELYELDLPQLYQLADIVTDEENKEKILKTIRIKKEGKA